MEDLIVDELAELTSMIRTVATQYVIDKRRVKEFLQNYRLDLDALKQYLGDPDGMPYGRRLMYQDSNMEVILMNWASEKACLPHDHGKSEGWVKVLRGTALHGYYANKTAVPTLIREEKISSGSVIYAPFNMVHHMGNASDEPLITLHIYFPSIHGMEVFDLDASEAAVVSSDCGAWWPQSPDQLIKRRILEQQS